MLIMAADGQKQSLMLVPSKQPFALTLPRNSRVDFFNSFVYNKLGAHLLPDESRMKSQTKSSTDLPIYHFERQQDWTTWLSECHNTSSGVWLKLAKKGADTQSVSYDEAVEVALCFGWIDGQKQTYSEQFWLQMFTGTLRQKHLVQDQ